MKSPLEFASIILKHHKGRFCCVPSILSCFKAWTNGKIKGSFTASIFFANISAPGRSYFSFDLSLNVTLLMFSLNDQKYSDLLLHMYQHLKTGVKTRNREQRLRMQNANRTLSVFSKSIYVYFSVIVNIFQNVIQIHATMTGNVYLIQVRGDIAAIVPITQQAIIVKSVSFQIFIFV